MERCRGSATLGVVEGSWEVGHQGRRAGIGLMRLSYLTPRASAPRPLLPVVLAHMKGRYREGCRHWCGALPEWPLSLAARDGTRPIAVARSASLTVTAT